MPIFAVEHLEDGTKGIRYALAAIKGVGSAAMGQLVEDRNEKGEYKTVYDLATRLDSKVMNKRQLENLIKAGALDNFGMSRAALMESVETLIHYSSAIAQEKASGQTSLFGGPQEEPDPQNLPKLSNRPEWDIIERLQHEFSAVGFYLSAHPLDSEEDKLRKKKIVPYSDLLKPEFSKGRVKLAGVILKKQERTSAKGNRFAFVQLSDPTGVFEAIIFSDTLFANKDILKAGNTVVMNTDVQAPENEGDEPRLLGQGFELLDDALANATQTVEIEMDNLENIEHLNEMLHGDGEGDIRVKIFYEVGSFNVKAEFTFDQRFDLQPATIRSIRELHCVKNLREH